MEPGGGGSPLTTEAEARSACDEQLAVIEAPASERLAVTAGPGAGKTYTLLKRAAHLIEEGLEPATQLAIFSFSRAAVRNVAERNDEEASLGRLFVRTVDSFASSLLFEAGVDADGRSHDARIELAIEVLESDWIRERLSEFRHVLIDEAQDVVGIRADFLRALLERLVREDSVGFTLFGDAAQAIYDFEMATSTTRLLDSDWLESLGARAVTLEKNHRMEPARLAPLALRFGRAVRSASPTDLDLWHELHDAIMEEPGWHSVEYAADELKLIAQNAGHRTVGVLCRSNAEVLALGARLRKEGVDLRVQHRAEDRGGAPWLARLFGQASFERARLPENANADDREWLRAPENFRGALRAAGLTVRDEVELGRLSSLLQQGACPEALTAESPSPIVLSTIHRAKGLEFDVVYVVSPRWTPRGPEALDDARVLYVGMTRARTDLLGCPKLEFKGLIRKTADRGRAVIQPWNKGGKRWRRPLQVEVRVSDSDPNWHPGTEEQFQEVQDWLGQDVMPGDRMELHLIKKGGSEPTPIYEIHHRGPYPQPTIVGTTTEAFGTEIKRLFGDRVPRAFTDLVAEIPDTAAFPSHVAASHRLPSHGLHLRARVYGLATPVYD